MNHVLRLKVEKVFCPLLVWGNYSRILNICIPFHTPKNTYEMLVRNLPNRKRTSTEIVQQNAIMYGK